jgi:hypothetical protein
MTHHHQHNSVDGCAVSSSLSTSNMSTKTYLLLYHKKLQKKQHFHTTISLKSITMAFFSCVGKEWCVTATNRQQEPRYSVSMGSNAI